MRRRLLPPLALLLLLLAGPLPGAGAESYPNAERTLRAELVTAYETLGLWCVKKQLFAARDELARVMITLDVDQPKARAWLRYKKGKDGTWARRKTYKPPTDRKPDHRPAFEERREAILADLRPRVVEAIRTATPALDLQARMDAVNDWRPILGDDPALMALADKVKHEGRWRSADTVRSLTRRAAIRAAAQAALAARPKIEARPTPEAAGAIDLPWNPGKGTKRVAVYGTASSDMLASCVRLVHATEALLAAQLGGTFKTRDYFALYVMRGREHFKKMVDEHPSIQGDRKLLRDLSGAYIGHGQFVDLMETTGGSRDSTIQVATQHLLSLRYAEGRSQWMPGWVADGFALYNMTWLTGTHLSFTVDFGRYGQDPLFKSLFSSKTDWMSEARKLMLSKDPATLRLSLGLKVGRMGPRDFLASYAFVAWLHEARTPKEVNALLQSMAGGHDMDKSFKAGLGMSVEDAEARLIEWLRETGA